MLANTKIIQAALSKPKYLSRFFNPDSSSYLNILSTFAHQYTLDEEMGISDSTEIQYVINDCLLRPDNYVLKPQREGGGNNYFGGIGFLVKSFSITTILILFNPIRFVSRSFKVNNHFSRY